MPKPTYQKSEAGQLEEITTQTSTFSRARLLEDIAAYEKIIAERKALLDECDKLGVE